MDPSRWQSAKQLLADVVDRPSAEQRAYIEAHCNDPTLRHELLAMLDSPASLSHVVAAAVTLTLGTRIGSYEIVEAIGAGEMGEVYKARDTNLGRDVAIKVLPALFAEDRERLARFEREARLLGSLNHPHIAQIYGFEKADGQRALVMELVEGETLAKRIARGPVPISEALPIARQLCEALEAAHETGIIHRDLKPANIKVRPDGTVKVLDFGLARLLDDPTSVEPMHSPTVPVQGTRPGVILGTPAYMAPEQASGKPADRRADIWAFGAVLYELLTGRRAFGGDDLSDTLAAVLTEEPDWTALPRGVPGPVRRVLRRSLEKDLRHRLSAISDARLELDEHDPESAHASAPRRRIQAVWLTGAALAGLALGGLAMWTWARGQSGPMLPASEVTRLSFEAPAGADLLRDSTSAVISPNGRILVFVARQPFDPSVRSLWVRPLASLTARPLGDTHGAQIPFWSPDNRHVGFFEDQKLKTVDVETGHVVELCAAVAARGGAWNKDNVILFAPAFGGPLLRIPATGGSPAPVVTVDDPRRGRGYKFPQFLPDGDHFLAAVTPLRDGAYDIVVGSLSGGTPVVLLSAETTPVFSPVGSALLFMRKGSLVAQPFDVSRRALTGQPVPLVDSPGYVGEWEAGPAVSVSTSGAMAYLGPLAGTRVAVYDQTARLIRTLDVPSGNYRYVTVTRDGRHVALIRQVSAVARDVWWGDLDKPGLSLLSDASRSSFSVVWAPDGQRVAYDGIGEGPRDIYVRSLTDPTEHVLYRSKSMGAVASSWSRDGRYLLATEFDAVTAHQIVVIPAAGQKDPAWPYLRTPFNESRAKVSPDGRWLAYLSEKTGQLQFYVDAFPTPRGESRVTSTPTANVWWRDDSRELLMTSAYATELLLAEVRPAPTLSISTPRLVGHLPQGVVSVSVTGDLQRVVAVVENTTSVPVTIVEHWTALLAKR